MTLAIDAPRGVEFPRRFTAEMTTLENWEDFEPYFQKLEENLRVVETPEQLEQWLLDDSELQAVIDEEYSRRYIAMTCATDDEAREKAYLRYVETILPRIKPWADKLSRLYLECPARARLDAKRYEVYDRAIENDVKMFREENVALETEVSRLSQQYQKLNGAMTVEWQGQTRTLQQMAPVLEDTVRDEREKAWKLVASRRLADREKLDGLFDGMKALRVKTAANAGFANFRDYTHQLKGRFDYAPEDCFTFHEAVEQTVVPLLAKRRGQRRQALGVDTLKPWDLSVDPAGAARLEPFEQAAELEEKSQAIFEGLSGELGGIFAEMRRRRLLDLDSRVGKAPGGYQCTLGEVRLPFIFMNAAGTNRDVFTLLHEGGHAFHAYAARQEPLIAYRHAPMEFCEVASMAMEMFAMDRLDVFYPDAADKRRARERHLDDLLGIFPWIAVVDAFQHWIYLNPDHTVEERQAKFVELEARFSPEVDWSGLEAEHRSMWHRQLHIFELPFYYIEYGIAQLGALQLWTKFREAPEATLEGYLRGLALGGARPLPELFEAAGIRFDFSAATMGPLFEAVGGELGL